MRKIWDKIVSWLQAIPSDKKYHFAAGFTIAAFCAIALRISLAVVPAIFAGAFKEFFDKWTTGEWDWKDFAATCLGGILISIFQLIGFFIFR